MDAFTLALWLLRIGFVVCIYLFLVVVVRALWRDLRQSVAMAVPSVGRLVVVSSPMGSPEPGSSIPIDSVTSLGADVNNTIIVDDPHVAAQHALLTFRGRAWFLEQRTEGAETRVNGETIAESAAVRFGDVIEVGRVRLRLERPAALGASHGARPAA